VIGMVCHGELYRKRYWSTRRNALAECWYAEPRSIARRNEEGNLTAQLLRN